MAMIHGNVGEPLNGPKYRSRATTAHDGRRVAYLGGALVELAGAMIALVFIRDDWMEQRKGPARGATAKIVRGRSADRV
jgi:hypothetical protein